MFLNLVHKRAGQDCYESLCEHENPSSKLGMVVAPACDPSTEEQEAGRRDHEFPSLGFILW